MKKLNLTMQIIKIVTNILLVCYPFIIFLSLHYDYIDFAIFSLIITFVLRLFTLPAIFSQIGWFAKVAPIFGLFLATISWIFSKYQLLLYYPVMVSMTLLLVFAYSLKYPPTIIERFARMQQPDLPEKAIQYTRKVTLCWCGFFIFNAFIALITCLIDNVDWWTLYNGGISYLLIAILMGGEWLIRKKYQH